MAQRGFDKRESLRERIAQLAEQIAEPMGAEVVLVEVKGAGARSIVRTYIDQPGGVGLDDCARFSARLSVLLDVEDWIPFSYTLEVSSPGLDRPLVKAADYRRFSGKRAKIRTRAALHGQRNFQGKLAGVLEEKILLEIEPGEKMALALKDIEKANLIVEF